MPTSTASMPLIVRSVSPSDEEFPQCMDIRIKVFVQGQNVPLDVEQDGRDRECLHVLATVGGIGVATARAMPYDPHNLAGFDSSSHVCFKIGRVGVLNDYRGCGYGRRVMEAIELAVRKATRKHHASDVWMLLHSQSDKSGFYSKLGYEIEASAGGDVAEFEEGGIMHVRMFKRLSPLSVSIIPKGVADRENPRGLFRDAANVRLDVFAKEQGFPAELQLDENEEVSFHAVVCCDGKAVGTARGFVYDIHHVPAEAAAVLKDKSATVWYTVGRVAVLSEYRRLDIGARLIAEIEVLAFADARPGVTLAFMLHSQFNKQPFYAKQGYKAEVDPETGDVVQFLQQGAPHVRMFKIADFDSVLKVSTIPSGVADRLQPSGLFAKIGGLRHTVFALEQGYTPEIQLDEHDLNAFHAAILLNDKAIAAVRGFIYESDYIPWNALNALCGASVKWYRIGKVAVLKMFRGRKLGARLMTEIETLAREQSAANDTLGFILYSQIDKIPFYEKQGYIVELDQAGNRKEFPVDGAPHVRMFKF